jgi:hypothetical protein
MADTSDDGYDFCIMEHRRELIGGTIHREYGKFANREDALDAMRQIPWEFGVDYTVEKHKKK